MKLFFQSLCPQILTFKKNDVIFNQGELVTGLYFVFDGLAKVSQKNSSGKITFTRLAFTNDTMGHRSLFIHKNYSGTAEVLSENLQAYFLSTDQITHLLKYESGFARDLISKIANELERSDQDLVYKKSQTAFDRVCKLLFEISSKYSIQTDSSCHKIKSEITKKILANILMIADETVIRIMTEMENEGIIGYDNRHIVVKNMPLLSRIAHLTNQLQT